MVMLALTAGMALLLGVVGIYGVTSYVRGHDRELPARATRDQSRPGRGAAVGIVGTKRWPEAELGPSEARRQTPVPQ
jgi:hypothetical protein